MGPLLVSLLIHILSSGYTSYAMDGQRALVAWSEAGIHAGLLDDTGRISDVVLDKASSASSPIVRWDGIRYIVLWTNGHVRGAYVSAQGVAESTFDIPWITHASDFAVNGHTMAILTLTSTDQVTTDPFSGMLDVAILDGDLEYVRQAQIGSIIKSMGYGATFMGGATIAPSPAGFYAAWFHGRSGRYQEALGTRITLDGEALDIGPSPREPNSIAGRVIDPNLLSTGYFDMDLRQHGDRTLLITKRMWGYGTTGTWVAADGSIEGPRQLLSKYMLPMNAESLALPDGSIVLVWKEDDGQAGVRTLVAAPAARPRRRASRH